MKFAVTLAPERINRSAGVLVGAGVIEGADVAVTAGSADVSVGMTGVAVFGRGDVEVAVNAEGGVAVKTFNTE
jgi:hypothetical protein